MTSFPSDSNPGSGSSSNSSLSSRLRLLRIALQLFWRWKRMPAELRDSSLQDLLRRIDERSARSRSTATQVEISDAARWLLYRVPSGVTNTCLVRGLTLYEALRSADHPAQIIFGVRPGQSIEDGHAWIEIEGVPYLEPDERRHGFVEIFRHPEAT